MIQKRTSKAQWLEKALEVLETDGVNGVKVDRLAKRLGTSRSGFYWHFTDRHHLLLSVLEYWQHEYTDVVISGGADASLTPKDQLLHVMKMIAQYDLDRFEVPIRAWADHDPEAADILRKVYDRRFQFIRGIFAKIGFKGLDLDMRTRLWLCYATHGQAMFGPTGAKKQATLLKSCHEILTCTRE